MWLVAKANSESLFHRRSVSLSDGIRVDDDDDKLSLKYCSLNLRSCFSSASVRV